VASQSERELRDRIEQAQAELKRARDRLDQLEGVAADRDMLRDELEQAQADLTAADDRLSELEGQSTEALQQEVDELIDERDLLRQRLHQADQLDEQWERKVAQREAELAVLRAEGSRLRRQLAGRKPSKARRWFVGVPAALGGATAFALAAIALLRGCQ
jgi:small-conductance mechanosensitive channel